MDNRMGWVRQLDKVSEKNKEFYFKDYEIASEARIPGGFEYEDKFIQLNLSSEKFNHLYRYNLRIKYPSGKFEFNHKNKSKKGYCFIKGVVGEILALISIFFRCRFYLISSNSVDEDGKPYSKNYNNFEYTPISKNLNPALFEKEKNNFCIGLKEFLDNIKILDGEYHQQVIQASDYYLMALKEIGRIDEMFFVRMVSAIESLAKYVELSKKEDIFQNKKFDNIISEKGISSEEYLELKNIFNVRKSKKRFIEFINKYSSGFFKGGNYKSKRILKKDLIPTISNIYNSRSNYLHEGRPMYLSLNLIDLGEKWDTDPSMGMIIDNREFSEDEKLPYIHWFEKLVRHCILRFIKDKIKNNN